MSDTPKTIDEKKAALATFFNSKCEELREEVKKYGKSIGVNISIGLKAELIGSGANDEEEPEAEPKNPDAKPTDEGTGKPKDEPKPKSDGDNDDPRGGLSLEMLGYVSKCAMELHDNNPEKAQLYEVVLLMLLCQVICLAVKQGEGDSELCKDFAKQVDGLCHIIAGYKGGRALRPVFDDIKKEFSVKIIDALLKSKNED